jgi:hypothetical protein
MPLKSDIIVDAGKFDPANNSEQANKFNEGLIARLSTGKSWHEVRLRSIYHIHAHSD